MAYTNARMSKSKFIGKTVKGEEYEVSTHTGDQNRQCMEHLRYEVEDGGDHTMCKMKVVGAPTSWPAEMVK